MRWPRKRWVVELHSPLGCHQRWWFWTYKGAMQMMDIGNAQSMKMGEFHRLKFTARRIML